MALFDAKLFNAEVFEKYMERIPNVKLNELVKSRAIRPRQDLVSVMSDQVGGNYITTPLTGLINGSSPVNYDGATNITSSSTVTFSHSRVVVGRAKAWTEKDFSYDITGGVDFMENVAQQIAEYWDEIDQNTIVSILKGVFSMTDDAGRAFIDSHTYDVTTLTNTENAVGKMDGTTLNTAMQRACGDHKSRFSLAIMHSMVATNLENLKLLVYLKYNDAEGLQRDLSIGTLNGRIVLVDDSMPTTSTKTSDEVLGEYEVTISTALGSGDSVIIAGVKYDYDSGSTTATAQATDIVTALQADTTVSAKYTISRSGAKITFTENTGKGGVGAPVVDDSDLTTGVVTETTVTAGKAAVYQTAYTTFVFGDGAIEYTNCGAKVPYEMDRNPAVNGGQDTLYSRQRKCFAPYGISFTKAYMSSASPTDAELENGANWELVNSNDNVSKQYISAKAIPIARIISLG